MIRQFIHLLYILTFLHLSLQTRYLQPFNMASHIYQLTLTEADKNGNITSRRETKQL